MNNNVLEFYVKMKDLMSSGLAKLATTSREKFSQIQGNIDKTIGSNNKLTDSFDKVERKIKSSSAAMPGWISQLTAAVSVMAMLGFAKSSINSAMEFGATKKSFEVLTGSKASGEGLANNLNKLQQDTILGPEVFKAAQTMMGFGIGFNEVEKDIKQLGDVSMGNTERYNQLTLAFSQTRAAGRLMGQDLLQYINAGFNPLQTMSEHWKEFGFTSAKSVGDLKQGMEKGLITSAMVSKSFEIATNKGGKYYDMMNQIATTPYGKMKILEGAFESLKIKTGETLMPVAEFFMKVANFLLENSEIVFTAAGAWAAYAIVTKSTAIAQGVLNTVMSANPIVVLITLILGLIVAIYRVKHSTESWGDSIKNLWGIAKDVIGLLVNGFGQAFETIVYGMDYMWLKAKKIKDESTHWLLVSSTDNYSSPYAAQLKALEDQHNLISKQRSNSMSALRTDIVSRWINGNPKASAGSTSQAATDILNSSMKPGKSGGSAGGDKSVAAGIAGGGPRVINISIGKMVEKLEIHANGVAAGLDDMERKVEEHFLRILNSGASVQGN